MIFEWETLVTQWDDLRFEGRECCMDVLIAYDPDDGYPFRLHVVLFCDFERDTYHTREDLGRELRELNESFEMGMDVDLLLEEVDDFLARFNKEKGHEDLQEKA